MMQGLKENILDLFFPPHCVVCNRIGTMFCDDCMSEIIYISEQACPKCNRISEKGKYCKRCHPKASLAGVISVGYFKDENLKEAIHQYKYEGISSLSLKLGAKLGEKIKKENIKFDVIAYVPISKKRMGHRGFNQAELLAKELSMSFQKPLLSGLRKIKDTKTQVGLAKKEREENLRSAFRYKGPAITGKRILLVDDVVTTGTTLNECAKILKEKGAKSVWGAVIAKE